jgi:hypothetical protein
MATLAAWRFWLTLFLDVIELKELLKMVVQQAPLHGF